MTEKNKKILRIVRRIIIGLAALIITIILLYNACLYILAYMWAKSFAE